MTNQDMQYNDQKENEQHGKQWATQPQLKTIPSFIYSWRVSSSWSTNGTCRVFKNPMLSHVRGKNEIVISVKGTNS
jgi:hypothetical protein